MARADTPDLWAARIAEQLEGLARVTKVSLVIGDPILPEGERVFVSQEAFFAGDTLTIRTTHMIGMEK